VKTFSEWLKIKETGTSTSCVAAYARPILSVPVRRDWPMAVDELNPDKKKKKKSKNQV
jgi:hypothetical protein